MTLPSELRARTSNSRYFTDILDLEKDEVEGYQGSGAYLVATRGGKVVGLKLFSTNVEAFAPTKAVLAAFRRKNRACQFWRAIGSAYQLMKWREVE